MISYKWAIPLFLFIGTTSSKADQQDELDYLENLGIAVEAINHNPSLEGLNLRSALTDQGLVYFDMDKEIFFVRTKPLIRKGESLDFADRVFFDQYINQIGDYVEAKSPSEKIVTYMFTDISCQYCQRLHANIQAYLDAGITIRFLMFPRNGLETTEAKQMASIMESEAPLDMLHKSAVGGYIPQSTSIKPIEHHFRTAVSMGVTSTPSLVVNGYIYNGFLEPNQILNAFAKAE
ncbi:thioredoxin fold domain-containing protein [Enterovibrio norvegicus]|uniref:thioredoxin fold domain-containing protein n=1 Tax=Enterovibrio norvegicus TaxID=188144 RepID=UPI00389B2D22